MKSDLQIQKDVIAQLNWQPEVNAAEIGVSVKEGVVTLSGIVDNYIKKIAAERAAKAVAGVRAVAENIQVGISPKFRRTDTEIAGSVLNMLKWHSAVDEKNIKIKVEDGVVTLEGEVDWHYERKSIQTVIEGISGIRLINNFIQVKPAATAEDIKQKITSYFERSATIDAKNIVVEIVDNKAILHGKVSSIREKEEAAEAAWAARGIVAVDNQLEIYDNEPVLGTA